MALYMLPRSVYATPGQIGLGEFGSVPNDQEHGGLTVVTVARTAATSNFMAPGFGYLTVLNGKRGGGKPERGLFFVRALLRLPDDASKILPPRH